MHLCWALDLSTVGLHGFAYFELLVPNISRKILSATPPRASCCVNLPLKTVVHFTLFLREKLFFSGDVLSSGLSSLDCTLWLRIRSRLVFVCSVGVEKEGKKKNIHQTHAWDFWVPHWYLVPIFKGLPIQGHKHKITSALVRTLCFPKDEDCTERIFQRGIVL